MPHLAGTIKISLKRKAQGVEEEASSPDSVKGKIIWNDKEISLKTTELIIRFK